MSQQRAIESFDIETARAERQSLVLVYFHASMTIEGNLLNL